MVSPWLVIALCRILGPAAGHPNLTASDDVTMVASVYVRPPTSGNPSDAVQGEQYARSLAQLFASLAPASDWVNASKPGSTARASESSLRP